MPVLVCTVCCLVTLNTQTGRLFCTQCLWDTVEGASEKEPVLAEPRYCFHIFQRRQVWEHSSSWLWVWLNLIFDHFRTNNGMCSSESPGPAWAAKTRKHMLSLGTDFLSSSLRVLWCSVRSLSYEQYIRLWVGRIKRATDLSRSLPNCHLSQQLLMIFVLIVVLSAPTRVHTYTDSRQTERQQMRKEERGRERVRENKESPLVLPRMNKRI